MFGKRSCAVGKSAVESSTIAVFCLGQRSSRARLSGTARPRIAADEIPNRAALPDQRSRSCGAHRVVLDGGRLSGQADDGSSRTGERTAAVATPRRARAGGSPSARRLHPTRRTRTAAAAVDTRPTTSRSCLQPEQELERRPVDVVVLDEQDPDRLHGVHVNLLREHEQRVMRLAAMVLLDVEAGMASRMRDASEPTSRSSSPVISIRKVFPPASARSTTSSATAWKSFAADDRPVVDQPEPLSLPHRDAVDLRVARGPGDLSRGHVSRASRASAARSPRRQIRWVAADRGETGGHRPRRDDRDRLGRMPGGLLGAQDDVRVVRQDDHRRCRARLDRREDLGRRRVHRLPAFDDSACRRTPSKSSLFAVPGRDDDDSRLEVTGAQRRRQPLLALPRLLVHVGDLGLEDLAERWRRARTQPRDRPYAHAP